jgi:hypothetical protein
MPACFHPGGTVLVATIEHLRISHVAMGFDGLHAPEIYWGKAGKRPRENAWMEQNLQWFDEYLFENGR